MKKVLFVTLALLLAACGGEEKKSEVLKVGAMSSLDYIPYVLAEELGYTDSLGVDLEIVKFFSANDRDAAFRSGQVDGTVTDYTGAAIQHAAGLPLALVVKHDGYFEMMAQPSLASMAELKGKKVSVSRNTVIEYATDKMLEVAGLSPEEVEKPEVNKIPLRMEMMVGGEVDASVFPDPFITISKAKGFVSLSSTRDLGISVTGTIFSQKALTEKGEAIKALMTAYNLAVDYINSHPREEWQEILIEDAGIPAELVSQVVLPTYRHAEQPSQKEIKETIEWLKARALVPVEYEGEGLVYSGIY
ncbi:ABC transporter substrate-binding protein [Porphyromonas levii]|uniref:ABC transporter substrate-binding protein n=1 Tax=Porphyromonas levii TaxID=28114 RepID=UPI0003630780|nr:ABC transporter substrate-binding protein [Porphyromonas levii]MBR8703255.1 hypothetical protein [Porphyromonas levii]MBR8712354.1 hypothetical protein [Porphyromonas levii]MBR8714179.1 hypothetical protein [Porphyromonas levii]MBR8726721.1 hypothetical protein [Porphyromonas levii]MBR8728794.1 hypothetical protein [Porphyromonas levii]